MNQSYEIISNLTQPSLPLSHRRPMLRKFAQENGWIPSFEIDYPNTEALANGHIAVEHGLDTTAVISFLKRDRSFVRLSPYEQIHLLSISYNNLVDWHLFPDTYGLTLVHNRIEPMAPRQVSLEQQPDVWRVESFEKVTKVLEQPNLKSIDDALVETLLFWKRALAAEMGRAVKNENISALFNGLILIRAVEDNKRWERPNVKRILFDCWANLHKPRTILSCIRKCFRLLECKVPKSLLQEDKIGSFNSLSEETILQLFGDFYKHRYIPYEYDFSLISKHALSKIYEHYVSILQHKVSPQLTLFPELPKELKNKALAGFYTPQYIARFFARYLKENLTPKVFRGLRTADPACGSGIFLRTILEMQCDPWQEVDMRFPTEQAFKNIFGIDIDENACHATRLSIALLYLVLKGKLPKKMNVRNAEAIEHFQTHPNLRGSYDVVLANPPYIAWDQINRPLQERITNFMGQLGKGKIDTYLAHLKIGLEMIKPGGFLLYVLPHSFLIAKNAQGLRKEINSTCLVRFLADLSEIPVFEDLGSYVILLVLQKKAPDVIDLPKATIVRCREFVGHALQLALEGKTLSEDLYDIYELDQSAFKNVQWELLPPKQMSLKVKISQMSLLEDFLTVKEGFITGADDIFIRNIPEIPKKEKELYISYLSDRKMGKYVVPKITSKAVFYPYVKGLKLTEKELQERYPETWKYLKSHSKKLKCRKSVLSKNCEWWCPVRPRPPQNLLRPKIVSPHLILLSKFSLDKEGNYGVSRSPLMYQKNPEGGLDLLYYFLAILNSSVVYWQITNSSHKYSHGYVMLEPKTLKKIYVPNPASVPADTIKLILALVEKRLDILPSGKEYEIEQSLDYIIADLYGLTETERLEIGMES